MSERRDPRPGWREQPSAARLAPDHPHRDEILARHAEALAAGQSMYRDPATRDFVFTAAYLAARGSCCETGCRHCPWVD